MIFCSFNAISFVAKIERKRLTVHWVCYKENKQRVLLFTESEHMANSVKLPLESAKFNWIFSIHSIGLSLVKEFRFIYNPLFNFVFPDK